MPDYNYSHSKMDDMGVKYKSVIEITLRIKLKEFFHPEMCLSLFQLLLYIFAGILMIVAG